MYPSNTKDRSKLDVAKAILKDISINRRHYSPESLMQIARDSGFDPVMLTSIVTRCRARRQKLLHGSLENPTFHPIMFLRLQWVAYRLQNEMKLLFRLIFVECGDEDFLEEIEVAEFIDLKYLRETQKARKYFLKHTEDPVPMWDLFPDDLNTTHEHVY